LPSASDTQRRHVASAAKVVGILALAAAVLAFPSVAARVLPKVISRLVAAFGDDVGTLRFCGALLSAYPVPLRGADGSVTGHIARQIVDTR
jgi:hypothetical protein